MSTTSNTTSFVKINRAALTAVAVHAEEPYISQLGYELNLPAGIHVDEVFVQAADRDRILRELCPDHTISFEKGKLSIDGPTSSAGMSDVSPCVRSELFSYLQDLEDALSAVTKPGDDVVLDPGVLRCVSYRVERGWADEASLRALFCYWSMHRSLLPGRAKPSFGNGVAWIHGEDEFGWESPECRLTIRWVPQSQALQEQLASHSLIACEARYSEGALEQRLGSDERLALHEAIVCASTAMRYLLSAVEVRTGTTGRSVQLGELIHPMKFFVGDRL